MSNNSKQFWQSPWGYPQSILVVAGIFLAGSLLQIISGSFSFYLLAQPVNLIFAAVIVSVCALMGIRYRHNNFVRWLSGVHLSVSLIVMLLVLTFIMGIVPQLAGESNSRMLLGWDAMTSSWPFVLVYFATLLSLGTIVFRRLAAFKLSDYAFHLNHIGLWLLLMASGLGYADMERYVMYVQEGSTEWRVYDDQKNMKELPLAIELMDFDMDVYPPKLAVIDRQTGEVQPPGNPQFLSLDADNPSGVIAGCRIDVEDYIHEAVRNSDSTYRHVPMPGSSPAALVTASYEGTTHNGWICAGNRAQLYMTLPLDDKYSVVMTAGEPRSFTSDIVVYQPGEDPVETRLMVNHPYSAGSWTIYQHGYDNDAGRLSSYSSFELVYDPWLNVVYVGIFMLMAGSVSMLWSGRNRKEVTDDVE
jgi:hypothetical protein